VTKSPAIELRGITKRYSTNVEGVPSKLHMRKFLARLLPGKSRNPVPAIDNLAFEVPTGTIFGLLGPNGAGKTTLIKILSTLVLPDSGVALVNGIDVVKRPYRVLKQLQAVLSEGRGFERRLTGRQNLEFYADLYGIEKDEARRRIDNSLELVGLSNMGHLSYQRYSTGMARRLLVCRALISKASIILFDEPTSGMDPGTALDFRKLMVENLAKQEGRTIIITTHNMWEAQQVCDRIAVLDKGRMIALGSPTEIRSMVGEKLTLSIGVAGLKDQQVAAVMVNKIAKVNGVHSASLNGSANEVLHIEGVRDLDYTEIFRVLVIDGIKIVSVEASQPSLEDAFVYLTRKER